MRLLLLTLAIAFPLCLPAQSTGDVLLGVKSASGGLGTAWVTKTASHAIGWDSSGNLTAIPTGSGGGTWGSITGTLSAQTDLQAALNARLAAASNLSDLANAATARANLGLGTLATQSATITDYLTTATAASTYASLSGSYSNPAWITSLAWSKVSSTPTTLAGYGITDALTAATAASTYASLSGSYANPAWITSLAWSKVSSTPTTLAGYGITDALSAATAASTYASLSGSYADPAWITSLAWSKISAVPAMVTSLGALGLDTGISTSGMADAVVTSNGSDLVYRGLSTGSFSSDDGGKVPVFGSSGTLRCTSAFSIFGNGTTGRSNLFFWTPDNTASVQIRGPANGSAGRTLEWPLSSGTLISTGDTGTITNAMLAGSIAASKLVGTDITTVGTITTGTWQGSIIAPAYLGTGSSISTKYLRGDGTWQTIAGGGDALTTSPLSQFAATTSAQFAGVISDETGTGAVVLASSPTLTTPNLGTPSALTLTNATGLPLSTGVTGTLPIANGGTGQTSQTAAFDALAPSTTKGDIIVHNGTDNVRVAVGGTNGHVLTVDSSTASGVKWAAASGGGSGGNWVLISTTTISGNPSTLDFTFSGSYRRYRLELENVYCSADGFMIRIRTSTDGGTTFDSGTANYGYAYGAHGTYGPTSTTGTFIETTTNLIGSASDEGLWGTIDFYDPLNASLKTFCQWIVFGRIYNSAAANVVTGAGYRDSVADVDAVRLLLSSGTFAGGKVRLFGWSE